MAYGFDPSEVDEVASVVAVAPSEPDVPLELPPSEVPVDPPSEPDVPDVPDAPDVAPSEPDVPPSEPDVPPSEPDVPELSDVPPPEPSPLVPVELLSPVPDPSRSVEPDPDVCVSDGSDPSPPTAPGATKVEA